jgi:heterodisulfide reductase subunit A-like polyferredoxin
LLIDEFLAIRIRLKPLRQSEWSVPMANQRLAIIIIGGGIGGLASAIALRRVGWTVRVYERAPELREVGAGLSLWANAVRALE